MASAHARSSSDTKGPEGGPPLLVTRMSRPPKDWTVVSIARAMSPARRRSASMATTSPAYNFAINVKVTNGGVILDRSAAKRGWLAHFVIHNRSKQTIRFEIGGLVSKPVRPGKNGKLGSFLDTRGQYTYHVENAAKKPLPNRSGLFVVT